jgi:mannose-6-phosphate isomerase-like protein (cupin superfamily)
MNLRRFVTGRDAAGKSVFVATGSAPPTHNYVNIPGMQVARVWCTGPGAVIPRDFRDPGVSQKSIVPAPGGSQFLIVTFAPDAVMQSPDFNPVAAGAESLKAVPGLAELFETDNPGMHTTETVDYGIVLDGEIALELDDGRIAELKTHDIVIQNGTRHAWRNRGKKPAVVAFVLLGSKR